MAEYLKQAPMHSPQITDEVRRTVSRMLLRIEREGEVAVRDYSRRLDEWDPPSFALDGPSIEAAEREVEADLREQIGFAQQQVARFARAQLATMSDLELETVAGVTLGHRHIPVASVGSYVPGGRYPLIASAFMTVLVPKVAGVARIVACAPPRDGRGIHPATIFSMRTCGADQIVCLGGVQALAAMTFGLAGIEAVDMLVGPGNAYVAEAKRQLFGRVGIDLLAGPTEIAVIADDSADASLVAADLFGQAEHGPTSPAILISTSPTLAADALDAIGRLLESSLTADVAKRAWRAHGTVVVAANPEEAIELADSFAPEHLEVHVRDEELDRYLAELRNYGSLFLGREATVTYGDKAVGTNHVLPTQGAARYTGGLWVGKFLKTCTYQRLTADGTRRIAPPAAAISRAESLSGHALTATMRLDRLLLES